MRKRRYTGLLTKPISISTATVTTLANALGTSEPEERRRLISEAETLRLHALTRHYKIDLRPDGSFDYPALTLALAGHHVPAFKIVTTKPPTIGRPAFWKGLDGFAFWGLVTGIVEAMKADGKNISYRQACAILHKQAPYNQVSFESLYARFKEVSRKHPDITDYKKHVKSNV